MRVLCPYIFFLCSDSEVSKSEVSKSEVSKDDLVYEDQCKLMNKIGFGEGVLSELTHEQKLNVMV